MNPTHDELVRQRWAANVFRGASGTPLLSPAYVVGQGSDVAVVDLRPAQEAVSLLGYVPGSVFAGIDALERVFPNDRPIVLVSRSGDEAGRAALALERSGRPYVAALAGGILAWRELGLRTSRDPDGVRSRPYQDPGRPDEPMSRARVERHIGDPRNVRWMKLASMVTYAHLSCIDGRDGRAIVGTLGGDAGEFLLALAALERGQGVQLDEHTVARAFMEHVDAFGAFYMHSDLLALGVLKTALGNDPRLARHVEALEEPGDLFPFLRSPDPDIRAPLLEHLARPEHMGCGHLRLTLQHGDQYGVRPELVRHFLRAFYRCWWSGLPELRLSLLPGDHEEVAVLNVRQDEEIWGPVAIPLVSPAWAGGQMFVHHPDVTAHVRELLLRFYLQGRGSVDVPRGRAAHVRSALDELAGQQLAATLGHLAEGLPIYDVVFRRDGTFDVHET